MNAQKCDYKKVAGKKNNNKWLVEFRLYRLLWLVKEKVDLLISSTVPYVWIHFWDTRLSYAAPE